MFLLLLQRLRFPGSFIRLRYAGLCFLACSGLLVYIKLKSWNVFTDCYASVRKHIDFILRHEFAAGILLILIIMILTRLPFYLYFRTPSLVPDTGSYFFPAELIMTGGGIPKFLIRLPGYPLFLAAVLSIGKTWINAVLFQSVMALAGSIILLTGIYALFRRVTFFSAIALCIFMANSQTLSYEIHVLTESLYASVIMAAYGFLFWGAGRNRRLAMIFSSGLMAYAVLIRPGGLFFIVIFLFIMGALILKKKIHLAISYLIPFPVCLFSVCVYNYFTAGIFALTFFGELSIALATNSFWQQDVRYDPCVNQAISTVSQLHTKYSDYSDQDRNIIENTWQLKEIYFIFQKIYNPSLGWATGTIFTNCFTHADLENQRNLLKEISFDAIKKKPDTYIKFVLSNFWAYYLYNMHIKFDFYSLCLNLGRFYYLRSAPISEYESRLYREIYSSPIPKGYKIKHFSSSVSQIYLINNALIEIHKYIEWFVWRFFRRGFWTLLYFTVCGLTVVLCIQKGVNNISMLLFISLLLCPLGAGAVTCLVQPALERFSFPTQFIYYLAPSAGLSFFSFFFNKTGKNGMKNKWSA